MQIVPVTFKEAQAFIAQHHRHHPPPSGYKFGVGLMLKGRMVGVATVGRPVSRHLDDGCTAEVTRLCTDGTKNACSMLYAACRRAAFAMGYERIITYILAEETGASLKASGWTFETETVGKSWDRPGRRRADNHPLGPKQRWSCLSDSRRKFDAVMS